MDGDELERNGGSYKAHPRSPYQIWRLCLGEDSDTDDRFPSPLSIPTVHADEFPGDLDAASVPTDWKTENGKRRLVQPSRTAVPRSLSHTCMPSATGAPCTTSGSSRTACFLLPEVSVLPRYSTYSLVLWFPYFMRPGRQSPH